MKVSEMNARQKKAFYNIKYAAYWHIGGLENALMDNAEDSDEYRAAKAELADHDGLVATIYEMATTEIYQEGACCFNSTSRQLPQGHPLLRKGLAHGAG